MKKYLKWTLVTGVGFLLFLAGVSVGYLWCLEEVTRDPVFVRWAVSMRQGVTIQ